MKAAAQCTLRRRCYSTCAPAHASQPAGADGAQEACGARRGRTRVQGRRAIPTQGRGGAGETGLANVRGCSGVHPPEGEDREVRQAGQGRTQLLGAVGLKGAPPAEARSSPPIQVLSRGHHDRHRHNACGRAMLSNSSGLKQQCGNWCVPNLRVQPG